MPSLQSSREMSEIHGSEPRLVSGEASDERGGRQRRDLGAVQLLGLVVFWLLIDVFFGITVYYISCGKECKHRFSGVTGNDFADSLYFSSTTLTTTGFGDIAPTASISKAFTAVFIACNTFYINYFVYPPFVRLVQTVEGRNRGRGRSFLFAILYCLVCFLSAIPSLIFLGDLGWGNAFYTVVVSFSSTGYGDYTFTKMPGRGFNSLWLLISHLLNYRLGGLLADAGDGFLIKVLGIKPDAALAEAAANAASVAHERALKNAQGSAEAAANAASVAHERALKNAQESAEAAANAAAEAHERALKNAQESAEAAANTAAEAHERALKNAQESAEAAAIAAAEAHKRDLKHAQESAEAAANAAIEAHKRDLKNAQESAKAAAEELTRTKKDAQTAAEAAAEALQRAQKDAQAAAEAAAKDGKRIIDSLARQLEEALHARQAAEKDV